jgi:glyoxylase I family protein
MLNLTPLLQVFDMPRSVQFYCDVLGFKIVSQSHPGHDFFWAMLQRENAVLMLNTAYDDGERPATPDAAREAHHADTALFFNCSHADEFYEALKLKGWPAKAPVDAPYGMRQVYAKDPDGYEICFQHPLKK